MTKVAEGICVYLDKLGYKYEIFEGFRYYHSLNTGKSDNSKGQVSIIIDNISRKDLDGIDNEEKLRIEIIIKEGMLNIYFSPFITREIEYFVSTGEQVKVDDELVGGEKYEQLVKVRELSDDETVAEGMEIMHDKETGKRFECKYEEFYSEPIGVFPVMQDIMEWRSIPTNFTVMHNWKWLVRNLSMIDLLCEYIMLKNDANDIGSWELYYDRSNNQYVHDDDGMIDFKIPNSYDQEGKMMLKWCLTFKIKSPLVDAVPSFESIKRILEYKNIIFKDVDDMKFFVENGHAKDNENYGSEFFYDKDFIKFVKEFYKDKADLSDFRKLKENGLLDKTLGKIQQKNRWTK